MVDPARPVSTLEIDAALPETPPKSAGPRLIWSSTVSGNSQAEVVRASASDNSPVRISATEKSEGRTKLNILTCTWNVGHAAPSPTELAAWLPERGEGLDLIIVATQENAYVAKAAKAKKETPSARGTEGVGESLRATTVEDAASDDENENPEKDTQISVRKTRRFHRRPKVWRLLTSDAKSSVGHADLSSMLCGGKNLCGRRELLEHWERMILERLNDSASTTDRGWRICKHAVLAESTRHSGDLDFFSPHILPSPCTTRPPSLACPCSPSAAPDRHTARASQCA